MKSLISFLILLSVIIPISANAGQWCDELYIRFDITDGGYNPVFIIKSNGKITEKVLSNIVINDSKHSQLTFRRNRSKPHQVIFSIMVDGIIIAHVIQNIGDNRKILVD